MSQPMSFPRPRMRPEDSRVRSAPDQLPKRVPGAALQGFPGARNIAPAEQPQAQWRPYPASPPPDRFARLLAAVRRAAAARRR